MTNIYKYPRPAITTDCVVFGLDNDGLRVLLIQRAQPPFENSWALPGGFAIPGETLDETARRELSEETGIKGVFLEQLYTFSEPSRDPREHVISVAYYALVNLFEYTVMAASDAKTAAWFQIAEIPSLAFDHETILETAYKRLKGKIRYQPIGFELLPEKFPLRQLQHLYEKILDRNLDKRNFRKKILKMGILEELDEIESDVSHRAARLYRFDKEKYDILAESGFNFEV